MADEGTEGEVLIVGAGPVGLTAALALTRNGVRCRIVDRNESRTDKSKALVLWSRTLELLDGLGGAGRFLDVGIRAHGASLYGHADVDAGIFRGRFPSVPVAGMHSSFELAPWGDRTRVHLFTAVSAVFFRPS